MSKDKDNSISRRKALHTVVTVAASTVLPMVAVAGDARPQFSQAFIEYVRLFREAEIIARTNPSEADGGLAEQTHYKAWDQLEIMQNREPQRWLDVAELIEAVEIMLCDDKGEPHSTNDRLQRSVRDAVRAMALREGLNLEREAAKAYLIDASEI